MSESVKPEDGPKAASGSDGTDPASVELTLSGSKTAGATTPVTFTVSFGHFLFELTLSVCGDRVPDPLHADR